MKHVARKRFGQHFLVDRAVIEAIRAAIDPRPGDRLIEIGPGLGALTDALLQGLPRMLAVEIDRDLAARLAGRYGERLELMQADVLGLDFSPYADGTLRVVGNLPYNISSPLLVHLLRWRRGIRDQHFMLQKEVVSRLVAAPSTSEYGRLSVLMQAYYDVEWLFDVPPHAFEPPPRVDSAVFRMSPRCADDEPEVASLERLLARGFAQRRKMLRSTLLPWLAEHSVDASALSPTARAEEVPVAEWMRLARALSAAR